MNSILTRSNDMWVVPGIDHMAYDPVAQRIVSVKLGIALELNVVIWSYV